MKNNQVFIVGAGTAGLARKDSLAILLLVLLFYSCAPKKTPVKPTAKDYAVLVVEPRPTLTYTDFPATIQGQEVIEIRPMVDGYLQSIYVKEGAVVKKDQFLFKIKNPQYEQAVITSRAAISIAIADVNAAKMDVEKLRPLVEKDIVSKYELESAQYTLQSKEASLAQAYAALANANTNVGYTLIRSPQNGIISTIPYKIGALVSSTTTLPLTTLSDIGNVFAYFSINEKQLLAFLNNTTGNTIQDKLNTLSQATLLLADGTTYPLKGKIETASGIITTETGTASFKATFPNPMGLVHSGASATVRVPHLNDSALLVPQSSSYEIQDKQFVYVLKDSNKVFSRAINSKPTNDGQFLIVQTGLMPGDRVVINGSDLNDSTIIIPGYINADSLYKLGTIEGKRK
ncbi:efflux RND transporter periplasmic adaptor subunit [Flavitalea sp.]|nr:efflux RND transporter periplasmic adaptor subunit [Flavitalea sp.]